MDGRAEDPEVGPGDLDPSEEKRHRALGELAVGLAMAEARANHGHHALANAHTSAADAHRLLAQANAGDVTEHRELEEWHRWCAMVESQLAAEADQRTPRTYRPGS
ncbi:hypothetical protein [Planobispora takensis]|uniref:Uncharacterized protein n=1 Tax=Planobispora takensis TaxID=1367882 RepID=A0A8J3WT77_9ACTN|nr:hypothetical protein [Planobispora takensis]GII01524.1 hypothetical protein Pta02_35320 [Planobispora takensis]